MDANEVLIITPDQAKTIRNTFEKTDKEIDEDIQHLKDWLKKQTHLPQDEDEDRLRTMLQFNKFSLEKTKKKLDMYYSIKHLVPEVYENREPLNPRMSKFMEEIVYFPLPKLTKECHRVYMAKMGNGDPNCFDPDIYVKVAYAIMDIRMVYDPCLGDHYVFDLGNITLGIVVKITPALVKKTITILQKAYSDRIKGFHFLNLPSIGNRIITIFNAVMPPKLAKRIYVHKNLDELHKVIPKEVLPKDYGGDGTSMEIMIDKWNMFVRSKNSWLTELANRRSNEALRTGPPMDSDMFGMCGSFRKLDLD
ncbi:uncharacterized protein CBL_02420 [Carabus blaptoides fortunei]